MRLLSYLTLLATLVASGCKKTQVNDFPNVPVQEYVYLNNPSNQALLNPGGWVYAPGGVAGLVVYRRYFNNDVNDFVAYDRACPSHFDESCSQLDISSDDVRAVCSCSQDSYILFDGSPAENASRALFTYRVSFDGQVLIIVN
jgi:hypothetical protein